MALITRPRLMRTRSATGEQQIARALALYEPAGRLILKANCASTLHASGRNLADQRKVIGRFDLAG
jgi:hypothetical protein